MLKTFASPVMQRLARSYQRLYGDRAGLCLERTAMLVGRYGQGINPPPPPASLWDETDSMLITYADVIRGVDESALTTLKRFLDAHLAGAVKIIHILPFFHFSSDDGFSISDYRTVRQGLGHWDDMHALREKNFDLAFDLVLNHVSREHPWFSDFIADIAPARDYFIEVDPATDLSSVVRPRSTKLLHSVDTRRGRRWVWTTFSEDQIDLNFANPDVLFEFLDLLLFYAWHGARIIRLDAIAYLWKKPGTSCIHLPETHEIVKIFHDVLSMCAPHVLLLTETNVPHKENISYFGGGTEANIVYQFALPPLLLHALLSGESRRLTEWASGIAPPPPGCTFLNFTASHDGIGLRPVEEILSPAEIDFLVQHTRSRRGYVSERELPDHAQAPYELNITYYDALGFAGDSEQTQLARFLCSQMISFSLRGIPAVYFNSLFADENDLEDVERMGYPRAINRRKWPEKVLQNILSQKSSRAATAFQYLAHALRVRAHHRAFHPDAHQEILDFGPHVFAVLRVSPDEEEAVLCIHNLSAERQLLEPARLTTASPPWKDILRSTTRGEHGRIVLNAYDTTWLLIKGENNHGNSNHHP